MADSPVFVPSGAAVPTSPTPSESRAASPDGVETDPAQHCRDRDITEIDGEALGQSAQLSMAAAPVNWVGSIDSGRGQSSPMRGQQVQATSSLHSGAASASCAVSTRSAAEHGVPAERPSQPALELTELVLAARARELFPADATWPVGGRMPTLAGKITKILVLWAHGIVYLRLARRVCAHSLACIRQLLSSIPRCGPCLAHRQTPVHWAITHQLLDHAEAFAIGPTATCLRHSQTTLGPSHPPPRPEGPASAMAQRLGPSFKHGTGRETTHRSSGQPIIPWRRTPRRPHLLRMTCRTHHLRRYRSASSATRAPCQAIL